MPPVFAFGIPAPVTAAEAAAADLDQVRPAAPALPERPAPHRARRQGGPGGAMGTVVGGPNGMVMPGATSMVGWITVSDGGGGARRRRRRRRGTPA